MDVYRTKARKIPGTEFREVKQIAFSILKKVAKKSKRLPYIRSAFFNKDKVFLSLFLHHLFEKKDWKDRTRRLQFFEASIELTQKSKLNPSSIENPNRRSEILHRFNGVTKDGEMFFVQIKEDKSSGKKYFISCFPNEKASR